MDKNITIYNFMDTFYCCEVFRDKFCEEMVTEHMLVYLCSGELDLIAPNKKQYHLEKGQSFFLPRNHKMVKIKHPSKNGEPFKGLFLQLKTPFLRKMVSEINFDPKAKRLRPETTPYILLPEHPFLKGFFKSLESYFDAQEYPSEALMENKEKEAVLTLLQVKPEVVSLLFDFTEPFKIDLESYMNDNYKSDLDISEFAHYTGRSLSAFKKDFEETFHLSPGRWLTKRRLQEARRLMENGEKPLEVYLQVGFKNLSHFSTAFKREYGFPPSELEAKAS